MDSRAVVRRLNALEDVERGLVHARRRRACTHSDFAMPMSDSIAALPHGDDIKPIEGRTLCSHIVLESGSDTYCDS